jgi:photosystem II stability/assembly factor-like uncharacterized protein
MMRSIAPNVCLLGALALVGCGSSQSDSHTAASGGSQNMGGAGSGNTSAGGASAGGGSTTPPPPPPPVNCDKLSTEVGVWHDISPTQLTTPGNMETYAVAINPMDGTVFATGGNVTNMSECPAGESCPPGGTGILRSSDCGATWAAVSTTTAGTDSAKLLTGGLWALLVDQTEPQTMYTANGYGNDPTIFKSSDYGVNWTALNPDPTHTLATVTNFVQAIAIDPFDHKHLALTFHDNCTAPHKVLCFSQSTDAGDTWTVFDGPSSIPGWTISGWEEGASISILGKSNYVYTAGAGIWYTGDGGTTWTQIAPQYIMGSYAGTTMIAPDGTLYIGGNNLFTSAAAAGQVPPFDLDKSKMITKLANSPNANVLVTDGVNIYAGPTPGTVMQPYWTAPLSDPTNWTHMPDQICGHLGCRGPNEMAYDPNHHVIYSANWGAGIWRLVTQ